MNAPSALPARKAVGSVAPRVTTVLSDPQSHLSTLLQRLQMLPKLTRSLQQAHIQAQACAGEANPHISTSLKVFNKGLALEALEVDVTRYNHFHFDGIKVNKLDHFVCALTDRNGYSLQIYLLPD